MVDLIKIGENKVKLSIDTGVYSDSVISKAVYWLSSDYYIYQLYNNGIQEVVLEKKDSAISFDEFTSIKHKLNQYLIDFKVREIVVQETKNIRDILYVKAFSNNDDFEDYNLID